MKNFNEQTGFSIFSRFLLAVVLVVGVASSGWGQEAVIYSTGFEASEGFTAGTTYNNTTINYDGPEDEKWGTYFGTSSTNNTISGSQSMQMRWYTSTPENLGYTFTDFDLPNVTKVEFKAKRASQLISVTVSYSTDGGFVYNNEETFDLTTTAAELTYEISETGEFSNVRIKFQISFEAAPTGRADLIIDDIVVYGIVEEPILLTSIASIDGLDYAQYTGPSASQSFQLSGAELNETDVTVTAPANFQVSLQENTDFGASITLPEFDGTETDIWVRLAEGLIPDDYSGDVEIAGGGASQVDFSVSGTVYPVPSLADLDVAYEQDFSGFTATTGQPVLRSHLPDGWQLDKEVFTYRGNFESTTSTGGVYGNGALGIVQTGTAPNTELTATLYLRNNTGETIEHLKIDYRGLVRRIDVNGNPEWDVYLNDVTIDELNFKTENLIDVDLSYIATGLNISDGELITIRWETEREGTAAQKKIGFTNVEITPLSELPALGNPVFSIAAGTYFEDQTVFIDNFDDYEATTNIYYTLDGEDPTDADALYDNTEGILLEDGGGPITLKAIAIDGAEESGITTAEYIFPKNVDNIAAFRDGDNGTLYRITGEVVVLHRDGFRNRHFVRDATGSLTIWDVDEEIESDYAITDGVTGFVGEKDIKNSNALIVLEAKTDPGDASDTGLDVTPVFVTLEDLDLSYTGNLVTIQNAEFNDTGSFTATPITNYAFTDPTIEGSINFRTDFTDANYIDENIPEGLINLTAIVGGFGSNPQVTARSLDDFEEVVIEDPVLNASPTFLTGLNYFLDGGPSTEKTFTITGENFDNEDVTITAPDDFEIRLAAIKSTFSSSFTIENYDGVPTDIFVRLKTGLPVGAYSGNVTINFAGDRGEDDAVVAVSGAVLAVPPGLPYAEDFEDFESFESLPEGWTVSNETYVGNWGTGTGAGLRGNANVLGFQHTSGTGIFTATLLLINTTGGIIEDLYVSYMGMVAREGEGRSPEWAVEVNGTEVPALFYSTADSEDKLVFAKISGLNIAENDPILIEWSSDRGEPGGSSKQIGIGDVKVSNTAPDPILTVDPEELEYLDYLVDEGASTPKSFEVSGLYFIDQNVRITAPANFEIAKAEGGPFSNDDLILTEFSGVATDVFVRLAADLEPGTYTGTITLTVEAGRNGGVDAFVEVSGQVADAFDIPYANAFRSIEDNNRAVLQSFEINNADQETGAGGYLKIFPDGYIETPTIDFRDYDYILFGFDARRFGGDGGQELTVKVSTDDGLSYEVMEIIDIVDGPSTENFSYISYVFPLDLTDELNVEEGKLKIEMTDGTQSTRLRDFYILDVTGLTFNTDLGVFYQTLQEAVDNANHGDRIVFKGNFESLNTNTGPGVILAPGSNPPGCAVFTSTFTLTDSDILEIKINGYTPCDDHDQIEVGTVLTLGGADLEIDLGFAPVLFDTFVIMTYGTSIVGEFAQGDEVTAIYDGQIFTFSIEYGDGSVTLEVTNILDPSAIPIAPWAIFLPVIMMLAFVVRRLRKKTA